MIKLEFVISHHKRNLHSKNRLNFCALWMCRSFGRGPAPTSLVSLETEDPEHRRMMTQRARVQIKNFLPRAENEGDAIEKLRAKIESFQNRNRARR